MSCASEQPDQGRGSIIGRIKGYMELKSVDGLQREYSHYEGSTIMDGTRTCRKLLKEIVRSEEEKFDTYSDFSGQKS